MILQSQSHQQGIIIGASSDIGLALSKHFLNRQVKLVGTFRTPSDQLEGLRSQFTILLQSDFSDSASVDQCIQEVKLFSFLWDFLILCPGTMEPIGKFENCDIDEWEKSIKVNLLSQLRFVHGILPLRQNPTTSLPIVIFFAGGGTNSAPINFSAYTLSKIALIKAVEILDAEHEDVCFTILGPGWVNTKIHSETLHAGELAGKAHHETVQRIASGGFTPMSEVVDCCDWLLSSSKDVIGGRNFSVVYDKWGNDNLNETLRNNSDLYKLRRYGNDLLK